LSRFPRSNHAGLSARGASFRLVHIQLHPGGGDDPIAGEMAEVWMTHGSPL
jgi:hypothetical protein